MDNDVLTRNENGELSVRTVGATEQASVVNPDDVYTRTTEGYLAVRTVGGSDQHNLGWYATQSALETAHPTASNGDWAIVGSTDTVWVWDSDTNAWKDTAQKGQVESVNGKTGAVVLTASDVGAATAEQGAKADTAIQSVKTINGQSIVGEGNVDIDSLPDQTGQNGKFLTTDGTDASWETINALENEATKAKGLVITGKGTANTDSRDGYSVIIGNDISGATSNGGGILIGHSISAGGYFNGVALIPQMLDPELSKTEVGGAVVIGPLCENTGGRTGGVIIGSNNKINTLGANAIVLGGNNNTVSADYAIQIGGNGQTNSDANTFKVANANGNFELMSADGTIPKERLVNVISTPSTMPELTVDGWSDNTQTVTVTGVTATNTVFVSPAPASASDYASAGIICTAQSADSLTFTCTTVPTNAITVNVVIF